MATIPLPQAFPQAMRRLIGHCTVITAGAGDDRSGLVVTSGISLSADPPQVLFCVNRGSSTWPLLARHGCFGWSALAAEHEEVAKRFAGFGGVKGPDRYEEADWITDVTGALLLSDAAMTLDCEVAEMIDRDTHSIVIGRVRAVRLRDDAGALAYWNGQFRSIPA